MCDNKKMDEEIFSRLQSLSFSSTKLVDYLTSNSSANKTDYLIENHLINNKRRQFCEISEALNQGLIEKFGYELLCKNVFNSHQKHIQECKSTSISFGLKNVQNIEYMEPRLNARNKIALKEVNLKKFLEFRKQYIPDSQDLTENLIKYSQNKLDLKLFEPESHQAKTIKSDPSNHDSNKNQHVFVKPSIPTITPSSQSNIQTLKSVKNQNIDDDDQFSMNELKQINRLESAPQKQQAASTYKSNNMQTNNAGYNQTGGYHPAASIMNSLNKSNGVPGAGMNGGAANGMNNNQQYFSKLSERKYIDPPVSRPYKRRKGEDEEEEETPSKSDCGQSSSEQSNLPFKSARDQLLIDSAKKNNQQASQQYSYNQGSQAKRPMTNLPSRGSGGNNGNNNNNSGGSGINKKFNCPIRRPEDESKNMNSYCNSNNNQFEDDPRSGQAQELAHLKNIDQKLIDTIMSEVMDKTPAITWNDIAGLEFVKKTIKEIVIWPMLRPDIFKGLRGPPKGLLLFGPPGTGKTLIAKTIANESGSTFFNISSSVLTSKWQGESEKLVKVLFEVARSFQPSVIFIDEIDSLLSQRSDEDRESSRRLKTEFFIQMDGCGTAADERILLIGATNRPQELDDAARRRFVKKLYIPLPEQLGRTEIVRNLLRKQGDILTDEEIENIGEITDGYSGADMTNLCREAAIGPIRALESGSIINISVSQVRSINFQDFVDAMQQVRASVSQDDLEAYFKWNNQFGTMAIPK